LEKNVVFWPEEDERKEISRRIESETGFPFCVGFVDGSLIALDSKPTWNGEDFYTRKSNYCISAMFVCDDRKLIRHCYTGWAGSSHDARVYANSPLARSPRTFFSGNEYLLADSAYAPSREIVPAYKKPYNGQLSMDNTKFNSLHANLRVRIEHCIGILKARFQSLKGMRILVQDERSVQKISYWIRCCCVLHNLLLKRGDSLEEEYSIEENGTNATINEQEFGEQEQLKRELIKSLVLG